jgi:hypothetical protein
VTRHDQPFDATLVLPLTDDQIAVIERRRAGGDIRVKFDENIVLGFDPAVAGGSENDQWPAAPLRRQTCQGSPGPEIAGTAAGCLTGAAYPAGARIVVCLPEITTMPPGSGPGLPRRPPRAARAPSKAGECMPSR